MQLGLQLVFCDVLEWKAEQSDFGKSAVRLRKEGGFNSYCNLILHLYTR